MRTDRADNKCDKCEAEATFGSPGQLCALHWAEWWVDGLLEEGEDELGGRTREELLKETLANIKETDDK